MTKLILLPESLEAEPVSVHDFSTVIGRESDCNIQIDDPNVSKYHALLVRTPDGYRLYDLYSANGTFVNDHRVNTAVLHTNDHLRFGPASFRFESEIEPPAVQMLSVPPKVRLHAKQPAPPSAPTIVTLKPPVATPAPLSPPPPPPAPPAPAKQEPRVSIRIPDSAQPVVAPTPPPPAPTPSPAPAAVEQPPLATASKPPVGDRPLRPKLGGAGGGDMKLKLKK